MSGNGMELRGTNELIRFLNRAPGDSAKAASRALFDLGHRIMAESQEIVPFDTGVLSASGTVFPPRVQGTAIEVELGYGGAASDYAVIQHENLEYNHAPGRQAKYLEQPVLEFADEVWKQLAVEIRVSLQKGARL